MKIKVSEEEYARRKQLDLPVTKPLRYMRHTSYDTYSELVVEDYEILETLAPSGSCLLRVTLDTGDKIDIYSRYFAEMQKPSFERDMKEQREKHEE